MRSVNEYLASVERDRFMPGAEPFYHRAGEVGCLLLHGWAGSCHTMSYLGRQLHAAGITAYCPSLPGHGTRLEDMAGTTARDWVGAALTHLRLLNQECALTYVVGTSMGANLTLYLAATEPALMRGIVTINGGIRTGRPEFVRLAFSEEESDTVPSFGPPALKDPAAHEAVYDRRPRSSVAQLLALKKAVEEILFLVTTPILILQSTGDSITPPDNAETLYRMVGSSDKQIVWLHNSDHCAPLDYDKDIVANAVARFIKERA